MHAQRLESQLMGPRQRVGLIGDLVGAPFRARFSVLIQPVAPGRALLRVVVGLVAGVMLTGAARAGGSIHVAEELDVDYSYAANAAVTGAGATGVKVDEHSADVKFVVSSQLTRDLLLRVGGEWQRFSFGVPAGAPVPATLQQASAVIGCDYQVGGPWIIRAELQPGVYSDFAEVTGGDVDAPLVLAGVYLANPDLQWLFGLHVDARSQYPVLPVAGVRWKFADEWTLDFMLPRPRLEYDLNDRSQLYLGGGVAAGTYRVGDHFGTSAGVPQLDRQTVDYLELRFGAGWSWKVLPTLRLEVEAGTLAYRDFNFFDARINYRSHGAPYGQVACHARF